MPWGVAAAAVAAYGSIEAGKAGEKGAKAQAAGQQASIDEQRREYDQSRADQAPWLDAGQQALGLEQKYLSGDTSGFENAPDYKFAVSQGTKQLDAGATAHGNLWGGGADADRISLGQGLATQYANNYWNKISGMAGNGQATAQNLGQLGANSANQIGQAYGNIGDARASSYANKANTYGNIANQFGNFAGQQWGNSTNNPNGSNYIPPINTDTSSLNQVTL